MTGETALRLASVVCDAGPDKGRQRIFSLGKGNAMKTPAGTRFLIQLLHAKSMYEAREDVAAMYGEKIAVACKYIPGTEQPESNEHRHKPWAFRQEGWSVFIPLGLSVRRDGRLVKPHAQVGGAK